MTTLQTPLKDITRVGPKLQEKLEKLHLNTIQDLLFHLPMRFEDKTRLTPFSALTIGESAYIQGRVIKTDIRRGQKKAYLSVMLQDDAGDLLLMRLFYFSRAIMEKLNQEGIVRAYGTVHFFKQQFEMLHPNYQIISDPATPLDDTLTPVYPLTDGLKNHQILKLMRAALEKMDALNIEELPEIYRYQTNVSLKRCLQLLHAPKRGEKIPRDIKRSLTYEECLAHQTSLLIYKAERAKTRALACVAPKNTLDDFKSHLPFSLTGAQDRVTNAIVADLQNPYAMYRLVQGDVGAGKTIVAFAAAYWVIQAGGKLPNQVAIMAPTEILAKQHAKKAAELFAPLGIKTALLISQQKASERREILRDLENGHIQLIIGTHALFQDAVQFQNLALMVIDEQHRFGVHQRLALSEKSGGDHAVHQLVMTATPIPRTLAMTQYAHLDVSVIDERPPGRKAIQTSVLAAAKKAALYDRLDAHIDTGHQAYWVCALIDESEVLSCEAAEAAFENLREALPHRKIGLIHGRQKEDEKTAVMQAFVQNELDILVATTVIEVGVDVPNATIMVIENAERFGLAQLHQLRGRIGRGSAQSYCVLLYGQEISAKGRQRLDVLRKTDDGFVIAEADLKLRGAGELLGTRQTGDAQFKLLNIEEDGDLITRAQTAAPDLLRDHRKMAESLIDRWLGHKRLYVKA